MADSAMVSAYFFAQKIEEFSSSIFHGNKFTSPFINETGKIKIDKSYVLCYNIYNGYDGESSRWKSL